MKILGGSMLRDKNKCLLITNNNKVQEKYKDIMEVLLVDAYIDVLRKSRDKIHERYVLLTHPLSGSLKPNQTPYKTILMEPLEESGIDTSSVTLIESAIETYEKFIDFKKLPDYRVDIKEDFETIDLSIIENAILHL